MGKTATSQSTETKEAKVLKGDRKASSEPKKDTASKKRKKGPKIVPAEVVEQLQEAKDEAHVAAEEQAEGVVDTEKETEKGVEGGTAKLPDRPTKEAPKPKKAKKAKSEGAEKKHHHHHHHHHHKEEEGPVQGPDTKEVAFAKAISARRQRYEEHSEKVAEIEKSEAKHAYVNTLINLGGEMNQTDSELSNFSEQEQKIIVNASGSAKVRDRYAKVMDEVAEKGAAVNSVIADVKDNQMVYQMVMHVGEVSGKDKARAKKGAETAVKKKNDEYLAKKKAQYKKRGYDDDKAARHLKYHQERLDQKYDEEVEEEMWDRLNTPTKAYERKQEQEEQEENDKGLMEFLLEFYNNVIGIAGDAPDMVDGLENFKKVGDEFGSISFDEFEVDGVGGLALLGGMLNGFKIIVDILKNLDERDSAKGSMDKQEEWNRKRDLIGNIVELLNNTIDFISPLTGMVPFLGTLLNMVQDAGSIAVASMETHDNRKHKKQIREAKDILKERIAAKKEKYKDDPEQAGYYEIENFDEDTIRKKRAELLAKAAGHMGLSKDEKEIEENEFVGEHWYNRAAGFLDKVHASARENYASGYGAVNERLASHMEKRRAEYHANRESMDAGAKAAYKKEMHLMEALELFNEYEVQKAAMHRMKVKQGSDTSDLVVGLIKLSANTTSLIGEILTATGVGGIAGGSMVSVAQIVKLGVSGYELAKGVGSAINSKFEGSSQRGKNKEYVRKEMGVALCERMEALSHLLEGNSWVDGSSRPDSSVEDYTVRQIGRDFGYIRSVRQGTDMKVSSIIGAGSRMEVIDSLSKAFSQDGN